MGLDTRAYRKATDEWKQEWVKRTHAQGGRPVMFGLMWEPIGKQNYGLTGGHLEGVAPYTVEEAPHYHQDAMDELPWPGTVRNYGLAGGSIVVDYPLAGGMISSNGNGPSFRGKVYTGYVEVVTGHSLYEACDGMWEGDELKHITMQLEVAADVPTVNSLNVELAERRALAQWFRVCVDNDLVVSGDA